MIQVKESKEYYINSSALTFGENDLENPNRVAVSMVSGTVILVYIKGTIDYAADGNFQRWTLKGYSTKLATNSTYYIYARLDRTAPEALITFSTNLYAIDGSIEGAEEPTPSTRYWYVRIGQLTGTDGTSLRQLTYDSGLLGTDKGINESNSALEEMFELNKQSTPWYIRVKHWFLNLTIRQTLTLMGNLIFGGKTLTGVATSDDLHPAEGEEDYTPNNSDLVTSGYVEESIKENTEDKFIRKDQDDETPYNLTAKGMTAREGIAFGETLSSLDFLKGSNGVGAYIDASGNWHIETDYLDVRFKFTATEVEIQHASHIGGKVINTHANMIVTSVAETSTEYICYMNTRDGEGNVIYNMWRVGDQAFCETFNLTQQADGKAGNHFLWRLVTEIGENYIILSKTDCAEASDAPRAGDELIALGNRTDTERQGAIIQASAGSGSPYIRIYKGINSYTLPKPKINLAPDGTEISADSIVLQSSGNNVEDEIGSLINVTNKLSREVNGSFYIWQADDNAIPTLDNEPAVNWEDDETKLEHVDDFYINTDGFCYQFAYDADTDTFFWKIVTDKYLIKFVEQIGEKRRVYVEQPTDDDVYDVGDTWVNATYPEDGSTYSNDVLVCIVAKDKGEPFSIEHWRKNSKYTDDTVANLVKQELETFEKEYADTVTAIQGQLDGKAETWYQDSDPSEEWENDAEHVGDLWYKESTGETFYFDGTQWKEQNIPTAVFDRFDAKASIFVSRPSSYKKNDMWILEADYTLNNVGLKKGTIVFSNETSDSFAESHWGKYDRYTDDSKANFVENELNEFKTAYNEVIANIQKQIDGKAETWYQDEDPRTSPDWGSDQERIGDLWCNTEGDTMIWNGTEWMEQGVPDEVFDKIDGKSSIFIAKPDKYQARDMWILEEDYILDKAYKAGTIVIAIRDMDGAFNEKDWTKLDSYSDAEEVADIKDSLQSLANKVNSEFAGSFYIWQGETDDVPTLDNKPAVDWTDDDMRLAHVDDFYISSDGLVYQFRNTDGVFSWVKVDDKYVIAYIEQMRNQLLKTGIDIDENVITVTAGQFKVQDRLGNPIAIFEVDTTTGLPTIKGEYLNVNYVNIADKAILLNKDGSGQLAKGNVTWDADGNVKFNASIAQPIQILEYAESVELSFATGFNFDLRNFGFEGDTIYLPSSLEYLGVQCNLFDGRTATTRSYYATSIKVKNDSRFVYRDGDETSASIVSSIYLKVGAMVRLRAMTLRDANNNDIAYWYVENPESITYTT